LHVIVLAGWGGREKLSLAGLAAKQLIARKKSISGLILYLDQEYFLFHHATWCMIWGAKNNCSLFRIQIHLVPVLKYLGEFTALRKCNIVPIDGQVRLVRSVRLQTDNFRLFFHKQTDE
jgi:hypothetical protein